MKNLPVDFNRYLISLHEAAHAIVFQYFNVPVSNLRIDYILHSLEGTEYSKWSGICEPKGTPRLTKYQAALVSYAGWYIENLVAGVDKTNLRFSSDMKNCLDFDHYQLETDVEFILEDNVDALLSLAETLYYQCRILMKAPSHYDKEFAEWDF